MRLKGHRLELTTERDSDEPSSTGRCPCGWEESHSTQQGVREEYRWHLRAEIEKLKKAASQDPEKKS